MMPKQTTLDEAIILVRKKYRYAVSSLYIIHPAEWALYNAWKDLSLREKGMKAIGRPGSKNPVADDGEERQQVHGG